MINSFTKFAGPICINPHTEKEAFIWGLVAGLCFLIALSAILGVAILVTRLRQTLGAKRKVWLKSYAVSVLSFVLLIGFGWIVSTGGSIGDSCRTADSSLQGSIVTIFACGALLAAIVSVVGFMVSFTKRSLPKE